MVLLHMSEWRCESMLHARSRRTSPRDLPGSLASAKYFAGDFGRSKMDVCVVQPIRLRGRVSQIEYFAMNLFSDALAATRLTRCVRLCH